MKADFCLFILIICSVLLYEASACATNGLCGYQPGCAMYAPPAQPCGCAARGYSCGSYGCYRHRVRGAKSYQPKRSRSRIHVTSSESSFENDREILRERLHHEKIRNNEPLTHSEELNMISRTVAESRLRDEPIDPNRVFIECCMDRHLPDACLTKCNFASYTKQALSAMYFKQDACPLEAMKEMQFCAAQGRDHSGCCVRNGVTTTLAGHKCLTFCDQRLGKPTRLDMSYIPCFDRFENMKACFWHDLTRYYKL